MNSDDKLGQDEEGLPGRTVEKDAAPSSGGAGATAVFGGLPQEPARGDGSETLGRSLPVVHSVVFKADSSRAEGTDQLMNILRSPTLKAEAPPPPAPAASSGGFTQLLRALNYEQVKETAAAVEPTQRMDSAPAAQVQTPSSPVPQVTSFQPQPVPGAPAGSFTQLFQSAAPVQATEKTETPPAAAPGSFTQMFRALDAAPPETARERPQPPAEASGPGSFTQMFAAVSSPAIVPEPVKVERVPVATSEPGLTPAAANQASPGSFTQMFRALDASQVERKESEAPVAAAPGTFTQMFSPPAAAPAETEQSTPGASPSSFTQVFRALDAAPAEIARTDREIPQAAVGSGSFTQMFQAVSSPAVAPVKQETAPAAVAPGSFTQMFGAPAFSMEPARTEPQAGAAPSVPGSFTQMFRTLDGAPAPEPPPREPLRAATSFTPFESAGPAPARLDPTPSSNASASGLTQLLRTLDQPAQTPSRPYQSPSAATPPVGGQQQPGSFTSVYGTLGGDAPVPTAVPAPQQQTSSPVAGRDATQAFRMPQPGALVPSAAPVEAGPSEFTRILNASTLRESALRGGGQANEAAARPEPSAAGAPTAAPWAVPVAPKLPQVPKIPEVNLPEAPKVQAAGGMQQYLPLLLILVIFLLLAILVAVVFLIKR